MVHVHATVHTCVHSHTYVGKESVSCGEGSHAHPLGVKTDLRRAHFDKLGSSLAQLKVNLRSGKVFSASVTKGSYL